MGAGQSSSTSSTATAGSGGYSTRTPASGQQGGVASYPDSSSLVNSLNEIQVLDAHVDVVRLLIKIDAQRFASAADDGDIVVWDHLSGRRLRRLQAHSRPVTALRLLDPAIGLLASGSSDRRVRVWRLNAPDNADDGGRQHADGGGGAEPGDDPCCVATLSGHEASVTCLEPLEQGQFVSGGNDRRLLVWSFAGELLGAIERQEEENLVCLLYIGDHRVVSASATSSLLLVYNTAQFAFHKLLASTAHREAVRCLERVDGQLFASASLDGTVLLWSSADLAPVRTLFQVVQPARYVDELHRFVCSVARMEARANGRFLLVAMGRGVRVFEVATGACTAEFVQCHEAPSTAAISLYHGARVVSAAIDGSLKVTALAQALGLSASPLTAKSSPSSPSNRSSDASRAVAQPYSPAAPKTPRPKDRNQQQQLQPPLPTPPSQGSGFFAGIKSKLQPSPARRGTPGDGAERKLFTDEPGDAPSFAALDAELKKRGRAELGEMWAHTEAINGLLALTETSFASCGSDGQVILWKDSRVESERRNFYARQSLANAVEQAAAATSRMCPDGRLFGDPVSLDPGLATGTPSMAATMPRDHAADASPPRSSQPPPSPSDPPEGELAPLTTMPRKRSVVPLYLVDYAGNLKRERQLSDEALAGLLREEGHAGPLVEQICKKLNE